MEFRIKMRHLKNTKAKGTKAERELIDLFWQNGYAAVRAAGSGSTRHPCPDIIASDGIRKIAIECKSIKGLTKYLSNEDIKQLLDFSQAFGSESWIGIRFDVLKWYFLSVEDLDKTKGGYVISIEKARRIGMLFEELIKDSII